MKKTQQHSGFTLVEIIITISLIAILTALSAPSLSRLISTTERRSDVNDLISIINLARNTAIFEQTTVTLCPIDSDKRCTRDWSLPIFVFRDPERLAKINNDAQIIRVRQPQSKGTLKGATGIHSYFRFNPSGFAWGAIGNITWCPQNGDPTLASQIRINMGGRPKLAKDRDNDGVVEDSRGKPVTCH